MNNEQEDTFVPYMLHYSEIAVTREFLEHLLNCLANQKYIDHLCPDNEKCVEMQTEINSAWLQGMELLNIRKQELGN